MADAADTAHNSKPKVPGKPFVKGDKRINRHGRPSSFDALRRLAKSMAKEEFTGGGVTMSRVQLILYDMMISKDPRKQLAFLEYAYGKVPAPVEITGRNGGAIEVKAFSYGAATAGIAPRSVEDSESSGDDESNLHGAKVGKNTNGG
jgi:hypothetical protein